MRKEPGRKPDYTANALDKDSNVKGRVGSAWRQEDGSIQITLDPWVVLQGKGHNCNLLVTLFPFDPDGYEKYKAKKRKEEESSTNPDQTKNGDEEDDIPF